MKCEECKYAEPNPKDPNLVDCRRYPPSPIPVPSRNMAGQVAINLTFVWPTLNKNDWCGEGDLSDTDPIEDMYLEDKLLEDLVD